MMKNIIIFGGGTSGWLTAAYLVNNINPEIKVTLIEDASKGPIGVGEGTQPLTAAFLYKCGIEAKHWMKPSNASFKFGVELTGWNDEPYFVDNDNINNTVASPHLYANKYFMDQPYSEFAKWHPAYQLAKDNLSPKLTPELDSNFQTGPDGYGAVHFSAYDIIATIKSIILDKIIYVDTKVKQVAKDNRGISKLIDADKNEYSADLYVDCSGFESILLEKTMGAKFISYNEWLMNDSAVTIATQYTNPQEECHPYTKATAMDAGWRWTIPTYHRIGNGYVYSSKHITAEDAEHELRTSLNEWDAPANHLKMKCGAHDVIAVGNVVGVGLAAGFVEPLEATGITFTTATVTSLCELINMSSGQWDDRCRDMLNRGFYEMSVEILTFVYAHYYFSTKDDTPYWNEVRKLNLDHLPDDSKMMLNQYYPVPQDFIFFSQQSMFSSVQWWTMIHAGGGYGDYVPEITEADKKYLEYFINTQSARVKEAKKILPNHYDFLQEWYKT